MKAGSIQDVKATPVDKVHTWPHLLAIEFVAALAVLAFSLIFSIFVNAPLLELANLNETPNPSKAPWYFLGPPGAAHHVPPDGRRCDHPGHGHLHADPRAVHRPQPVNKPEDRKFAVSLFTVQLMFWAVLVIIGSFFRGPGFNFVAPWTQGLFFEL